MKRYTREAAHRGSARFPRRAFLGGLGLAALAPFVPRLDIEAEAGSPMQRLLLFYSPFGTQYDLWAPSGSDVDFSFTGSISAPLEPHKADVVVLDGLFNTGRDGGVGDPHQSSMAALWSNSRLSENGPFAVGGNPDLPGVGWGTGISLDQYVAEHWNARTALKSLELAVDHTQVNPNSRMCYAGENQPITPQLNPRTAFESAFAGVMGNSEAFAKLKAQRKSVLDLTGNQLARLQPKVSSHDRQKIEAHLDAIRGIEHKLDALVGECTVPGTPEDMNPNDSNRFLDLARAQIEVMVHALACDLTRVGSIQLKDENGGYTGWLGQSLDFHAMSHEDVGSPGLMNQAYRDFHVLFGELLQRLRDTQTPLGSTLLSETLVAWGTANANGHHRSGKFETEPPLPMILAGQAGGALQTGRVLSFADNNRQAHSRVLVSMCHILGVPAMDGDTFGNILVGGAGGLLGLP